MVVGSKVQQRSNLGLQRDIALSLSTTLLCDKRCKNLDISQLHKIILQIQTLTYIFFFISCSNEIMKIHF